MLSYETAVKLEKAGFPQDIPEWRSDPQIGYVDDSEGEPKPDAEIIYDPTLAELIEVLGDKFHALEYKIFKGIEVDGGKWIAYSNHPNDLGIAAHIFKQGETPEEAVANLYLALAKK